MNDEAEFDYAKFAVTPVECACFQVRKASRIISQLYDEALNGTGIRATQYSLLVAIAFLGEKGLGAISEALATDRTTLTRTVAGLIEMGYARDIEGPDRRTRALKLTADGRAALEAAYPRWQAAQAAVRKRLGNAGVEHLREISDAIADLKT